MSTYDTIGSNYTDPTPRKRKRWGYVGTEDSKTVADAVAFCEREGLDPSQVELAHRYVGWESDETPDEIAKRVAWGEEHQREHLAKIRELYEEYDRRGLYEERPHGNLVVSQP